MARKLARKVISFEIAAIRYPLAVFEDRIGDRLPPDSALRRVVGQATKTLEVVAEATAPKGKSGKKSAAMKATAHAKKPAATAANGHHGGATSKKAAKQSAKQSAKKAAAKPSGRR